MTLLQAFIYYIVRLGLYAAVAAGGIAIGIRWRRKMQRRIKNR